MKITIALLLGLLSACSMVRSNPEPVVLTFKGGSCSGTAIRPHVILTAAHCLHGGAIAADGGQLTVQRRIDDGNDHTLLIVTQTFPADAQLAPMPKMGTIVHILGNPAELRSLYASGTVAGIHGADTLINVPVFFGDSGAAVFDSQGRIVGVVWGVRVVANGDAIVSWGEVKPFRFTAAQWQAAGVE